MDNYIVSARKYRPTTFQSVVGQKSLTTTLKNAIQNNKLAHAYLFCGPRGVGKTTCARIFAKTINCFHLQADGEACDTCESCKAFNENRSYNIYELDAASNNSVDDIRTLVEQVRIPPQIGKYKVYIIDEVHMLSNAAFNAFLKTLEEPPHHAIFILATTEKHKIIPTILSRCQIYDFSRITINDIVDHLAYVAQTENVAAEKEALTLIAQKADGGMRDALSMFDQIVSFSSGNISYQAVIENLNILDYDYYFRLLNTILAGDVPQSLLILDEILRKGFDGQHIVGGLSNFLREVLICKDPQTVSLFATGDVVKEKYLTAAQQCSNAFLYQALEWCNECDLKYRESKNKRLLVEILLIRLCQLTHPVAPSDDKKKISLAPLTANTPTETASNTPVTTPITPIATPKPLVAPREELHKVNEPPTVYTGADINIHTAETEEKKQETTPSRQDLNEPFSQSDLEQALRNYAETQDDEYLKNTLLTSKAILTTGNRIQIDVFNQGQEDKLKEKSAEITHFLNDKLRNTQITLHITQVELEHELLPVGNKEIYDYMAEKNPHIRTLFQEFQLEF